MKKTIFICLILSISFSISAQSKARFRKEVAVFYPKNGDAFSHNKEIPLTFLWTDTMLLYAPYDFALFSASEKEPIYERFDLNSYYLNYPWNAPELKDGRYYWQVVSKKNGMIAGSEFRVDHLLNEQHILLRGVNYFVEPEEILSKYYHIAYDKYLAIHYTHLYHFLNFQYLRFRIFDKTHTVVAETRNDGTILPQYQIPEVPLYYRENYVRINLETCPGIIMGEPYVLDVWNEKGEHYYLRFRCYPSFPKPVIVITNP